MKNGKRIPIYKEIWCKIRCWQNLRDISDADLANHLKICDRTLKEYDRNAQNITLEKLDNFLYVNNIKLSDLINM